MEGVGRVPSLTSWWLGRKLAFTLGPSTYTAQSYFFWSVTLFLYYTLCEHTLLDVPLIFISQKLLKVAYLLMAPLPLLFVIPCFFIL